VRAVLARVAVGAVFFAQEFTRLAAPVLAAAAPPFAASRAAALGRRRTTVRGRGDIVIPQPQRLRQRPGLNFLRADLGRDPGTDSAGAIKKRMQAQRFIAVVARQEPGRQTAAALASLRNSALRHQGLTQALDIAPRHAQPHAQRAYRAVDAAQDIARRRGIVEEHGQGRGTEDRQQRSVRWQIANLHPLVEKDQIGVKRHRLLLQHVGNFW
jgi:hypothetical protein